MKKKHFEAIANKIKLTVEASNGNKNFFTGVAMTAAALANTFSAENPRFDRARFFAACGLN